MVTLKVFDGLAAKEIGDNEAENDLIDALVSVAVSITT